MPIKALTSSPEVIRTPDPVVNSHLLCQLSYRGSSFDVDEYIRNVKKSQYRGFF